MPEAKEAVDKIRKTLKELPKVEDPQKPEKPVEEISEKVELAGKNVPVRVETMPAPPAPEAEEIKPEKQEITLEQIEGILSAGLESAYLSIPKKDSPKFKKAGEDLAQQIRNLIAKGTLNSNTLLGGIRTWLRLIPRANENFIEQEAKNKAGQILELLEQS